MLAIPKFSHGPKLRFGATMQVFLLLCGTFASAQTKTPSLDIGGVTFTLGMSRDSALEQLRQAGYRCIDQKPENGQCRVVLTTDWSSDPPEGDSEKTTQAVVRRIMAFTDNHGILTFRSGSLVDILKHISAQIETDRELAAELYALFRQYEKEGSNVSCTIGTAEDTDTGDPHVQANWVQIDCIAGLGIFRSTIVRWVTNSYSTPTNQSHVSVSQELRRYPR